MVGIARHTDYAARIVFHLAGMEPKTTTTIAEIAERRLLPVPFVRRLTGRLVRGGILKSVRGAGGGIQLAKPAASISLLDIVRIMEGGVVLNHCVATPSACPQTSGCPVHTAWIEATQLLEAFLESVRFDRLAGKRTPSAARGRKRAGRARKEASR
jgi:Rrf2 family protein